MTWTDKTYNETLKASNELVGLAMELNERLGPVVVQRRQKRFWCW